MGQTTRIMLIDPEPLLPTRGYRVLCHDATLIDLEAEGMWPMDTQLEWTIGGGSVFW